MGQESAFKFDQKNSLRRPIFLSFMAVMLIPMLLIGGIVAYTSYTGNQQVVKSKLLAVSALKEAAINRWLNGVETRLTESGTLDVAARTLYEFDRRPASEDHLIARFQHDIQAIKGNSSDFETITLIDLTGTVKASTDLEKIGFLYNEWEVFQRGLEKTYIQPLFYDDEAQRAVVCVSTPVTSMEGEVVGVLAGRVDLRVLQEILTESAGSEQGYITGNESYLTTQKKIVLQSTLKPRPNARSSLGIENGFEGRSDTKVYDNYAGVSVFGSYRPLDQLGAVLLVEQSTAEAFRVIMKAAALLALVSVAIAALTMYAAYWLAGRIVTPLQTLTQAASDIAAGDLSKTIEPEQDDEIGALALAFNQMTSQLRDSINTLESRVKDRTQTLAHRSTQLQTAIEVSKAASAITDTQTLTQRAVDLVKELFNFYYVGLFLVDKTGEWAVLRAGSGEAGQKQLEAKHRLKLDGASMIGWSVIHKQARITGDVMRDTAHYINPFLLRTQSEMALPLVRGGEALGAISIQSTRRNAFTEGDISVLQTVADQIAIALQNSRLLNRVQAIQLRFEDLYHRAPAGYHTMSTGGLITEINDTELAMLGYQGRREQIVNHRCVDELVADESKAQFFAALERLLAGEKVEDLELFFSHREGYQLPVLITAAPEFDSSGKIREIYASVQDISRRKAAEAAREALLKETETLYRLNQQLLTTESLEEIYQAGIEAIKITNPSRGIAVLMQQQASRKIVLNLVALWNNPARKWPPVLTDETFSIANVGFQTSLLTSGETIASIDGSADERFPEKLQKLLSYMEVKGLVAAPIWNRELVSGLVLVGHHTAVSFTKADIRLIEGIARQISLSIDNLMLFQEALQRATQLEAAAEVAKNTTSEVDLGALLPKVVGLVEEAFDYYHTAIFLVDEYRQYAVVEAAAGRLGKESLPEKYKLPLDVVSQVGAVIKTGEIKVTPNVTQSSDFLEHSLLPHTRSELTLPLIVHGKVIGVLDVASDKLNDFQAGEDVVLQTIADQLANAIYVARLFEKERAAAQEIQNLHKHYLQQEWGAFLGAKDNKEQTTFAGVLLSADQSAAEISDWFPQIISTIDSVNSPTRHTLPTVNDDASSAKSALVSPLILRDTPIGALGLIDQGDRMWSEDDLAIIEAVSAQTALAIENARLIEKNQRWALEQQRVAEKLREVDKVKTQFLANMSHELRTPLNSIIGFSRVILKGIDGPLTELQKTDLSSIHQSGKHLLDLINNILDLSKIEAGKMDINFESIDLYILLNSIVATAVGLVKDKKIKIMEDIPEDLPRIEGDETRIRQILLNLVSNSAKFTQEGSITIRASYNHEQVSISVSDTGIGIAPENRESIFDEFSQVDASTTRQAGGTGLGLPITRKFVELHHGEMTVESELSIGSKFIVTLPIMQLSSDGAKQKSVTQSTEETEVRANPTLLVIDGDSRIIDYYQQYLLGKNIDIVSLNVGAQAVEEAKELQPYAILLDILIPDADGWGILSELKQNPRTAHIPVIICSTVDDKFRGNRLGAADYLVKPIIKTDLLQAIDALEEHKRNLKQVLVIDDNAEDILLIKRILRSHECQIIEASTGLDGLDIIHHNPPNLVVLDLTMPGLDGFGVLDSLKGDPKTANIPVVVITARELTSEERKMVDRQANELLIKGKYTGSELLQCVDQFLQGE